MTIRVTGLNSGLDTDSIIKELVSAYRTKGDKLKKQQTKVSWTQDKWKSLNAKVLNLYKSLDNLRFTSGYNMKKTTVSDSTKATVTAGSNAVNGTQTLKISSTAKGGYLTGDQIKNNKRGSSAKLNYLDRTFSGSGTFQITGNGVSKEIELKETDTIDDFIKKINDSGTGVKATYDANNQRIFIASKETGVENDFSLVGMDENGAKALHALGVNTASSEIVDEWKQYYKGNLTDTQTFLESEITKLVQLKQQQENKKGQIEGKQMENAEKTAAIKYLNAYSSQHDILELSNIDDKEASYLSQLANMSDADREKMYIDDGTGKLVEDTQGDPNAFKGSDRFDQIMAAGGIDRYENKKDENGNDVLDKNGNPVKVETELYQKAKAYESNKKIVEAYEDPANSNKYKLPTGATSADASIMAEGYKNNIEQNNLDIEDLQNGIYDDAEAMKAYHLLDGANVKANMSAADITAHAQELAKKVDYFANRYDSSLINGNKEAATDAQIYLNGVEFTSSSNKFNINGLTIQANAKTTEDITITTATDTQGLYDKIKDFITEYNSIIGEMASLYNAESAKGYEPLTSEEKEALTESDIAEWEKKVKGSLLRRDSTLGSLITAMTSAMQSVVEIGDKKYSLATLGIKTGNYFNTTAATRNIFHIDGDPDDDTTSANADKLMEMLNSDPDKVVEIMRNVTSNLYDNLKDKMSSTTLRSYQSIYNDKAMAQTYSDYTKKISAWEEKVTAIEDSYYKKFAAMETALAKLQSQQSAFAGMLGS